MLATLVLTSTAAISFAAAPPTPSAEGLANQFIELLHGEQFDAAGASFSDQMKLSLPPEKLALLWHGVEAKHGKFQKVDHYDTEQVGEGTAELLTCRFAKSPVTFEVYLDASNHIAGFLLTPATLIARRFVNALAKSDVAGAEAIFDAKMRATLPAPKLTALWSDLLAKSGAFQQIDRAKVELAPDGSGDNWAAVMAVQFAKASVTLRVVVDGEARIVGFSRQ